MAGKSIGSAQVEPGRQIHIFTIHLLFIHLLIRFANPSILFIQSPIKRRHWLTLYASKGESSYLGTYVTMPDRLPLSQNYCCLTADTVVGD